METFVSLGEGCESDATKKSEVLTLFDWKVG